MDTEHEPSITSTAVTEEGGTRKRRLGLLAAALALVVLLGGAAFMAGKYLNRETAGPTGPGGGQITIGGGAGAPGAGPGRQTFQLEIEPAEELPDTEPDVRGIFVGREDNRLTVGTGQLRFTVTGSAGGEPGEMSSSYDGPEVEVVVTGDTEVYRDDSMSEMSGPPESGAIQQKVSPGSIEEIGEDSSITAWGRKSGDRVIAEVLVYSPPAVIRRAPGN